MAQQPTFAAPGPFDSTSMVPAQVPAPNPPPNPRKRRPSLQTAPLAAMAPPQLTGAVEAEGNATVVMATPDSGTKKKGRTNTPWTAEEEQRLKTMREIAKVCPICPSRSRNIFPQSAILMSYITRPFRCALKVALRSTGTRLASASPLGIMQLVFSHTKLNTGHALCRICRR